MTTTAIKTIDSTAFGSPETTIARIKKDYGALTVRENGIETVSGARKEIKALRVKIDKRRLELNDDAQKQIKETNALAKKLTAEIEPIEKHLQEEEDVYQAGIELAKQLKAQEAARKTQGRINDLTALGAPVDLLAVQTLTDSAFSQMLDEKRAQMQAAAEQAAALEAERQAQLEAERAEADRLNAIHLEELAQQQEELRMRAEEMERVRLENEAALARERDIMQKAIDEERAEIARKQAADKAEADRKAAEQKAIDDARNAQIEADRKALAEEKARLDKIEADRKEEADRLAKIERDRIRDLEEAENLRQWEAEQARLKAAEEARQALLLPEIEKAEKFCGQIDADMLDWLQFHGQPSWAPMAIHTVRDALLVVLKNVKSGAC